MVSCDRPDFRHVTSPLCCSTSGLRSRSGIAGAAEQRRHRPLTSESALRQRISTLFRTGMHGHGTRQRSTVAPSKQGAFAEAPRKGGSDCGLGAPGGGLWWQLVAVIVIMGASR